MPAVSQHVAFGLTIASELPLPGFAVLPAVSTRVPDLSIHFATLGATLPAERVTGDCVVLTIDKVARYRIRGGREIAIDPHPRGAERAIRQFLLGSAMGVLFHQRRLLPLHANAIVVDGSAVAFAGRTGIGKSTLAAHFEKRGFEVLCDDVCVVGFDDSGRPLAWPGVPRLKLWRDAAEAFGHDSRALERAAEGIEKYHVPLGTSTARGPYPLARLYVLSNLAPHAVPAITRLIGIAAPHAIMSNTYRSEHLGLMGLAKTNFVQSGLMAKHTRIFAAPRARGYDVFAREAARLEGHFMQEEVAV